MEKTQKQNSRQQSRQDELFSETPKQLKYKMRATEYPKNEGSSSGGIVLPNVQLEHDYVKSEASFMHDPKGRTQTQQFTQNLNPSEYLNDVKGEQDVLNNELVRIKPVDKNKHFNDQQKQQVHYQSSLLAQQNYAAFGQRDAKILIDTFIKRKGSIGEQHKLQSLAFSSPNEDKEKAVKDSYKTFKKEGRRIQHFQSIYNQYTTSNQLQAYRGSSKNVSGGRAQSLNFNKSINYRDSVDSISPMVHGGPNDSFRFGQSFYISGKKTIQESAYQDKHEEDNGFTRSLLHPKEPRMAKISPRQNINILYSAQKMNQRESQMRGPKETPNFIYDGQKQEENSSILLLQKQGQIENVTIVGQGDLQQKKLFSKGFQMNQSLYDKTQPYENREEFREKGYESFNYQSVQHMSDEKRQSLLIPIKYQSEDKPHQMSRFANRPGQAKLVQKLQSNTNLTQQRERSQQASGYHKYRKHSFMSYKIPDLNSSHWYYQDKKELINIDQRRQDRQSHSIESKLRGLTYQANPKTTTKTKELTQAEQKYYTFVEQTVSTMGQFSKDTLPQRKLQFSQLL